jgi:hypothetical protein
VIVYQAIRPRFDPNTRTVLTTISWEVQKPDVGIVKVTYYPPDWDEKSLFSNRIITLPCNLTYNAACNSFPLAMVSFFSSGHNYAPYITSGTSKWGFCFDTGKRRAVPELKFERDASEQEEGFSLTFGDKRKARASNGKRQGFAQQVPREDFESWILATNRIP